MWTAHYQAPSKSLWTGRDDEPNARLFQCMQCIDLVNDGFPSAEGMAIALIGFACDEGVRRNSGRVGAKEGPSAIRCALANLAIYPSVSQSIYDFGDIICDDQDLEAAQSALATLVEQCVSNGCFPLVLGGGHEVAWGHYQGLLAAKKDENVAIINFDAHFDLRPLSSNGQGSSGTPFTQAALACEQANKPFNYLCLGVQPFANTASLFTRADDMGCEYVLAEQFFQRTADIVKIADEFIEQHQHIYLTVCLDVFNSAYAPGVSAPQSVGLAPWHITPPFQHILSSNKVIGCDIVELAPCFDVNHQTARLAAYFVGECIKQLLN